MKKTMVRLLSEGVYRRATKSSKYLLAPWNQRWLRAGRTTRGEVNLWEEGMIRGIAT
jgi:hypothetical protein